MRLERAEQRLARTTNPQRENIKEPYARDASKVDEATNARGGEVAGGETPVTPPLRDPRVLADEPKGPTSDDEGDAAMDNWEATSAESDDEMPPISDINSIEMEILQIVEHLGGSRAKYSRQVEKFTPYASEAAKVSITEVYSPPRVIDWAKRLPKYGIVPGLALDLTTRDDNGVPWDFDLAERRGAARRLVAKQKPLFLVASPMCTAFCTWQRLNATRRDPKAVQREYNKAMVHLEFVCQLYSDQMTAGRYFLHEQPASNSSWQERCITSVLAMDGVARTIGDQCCYGQRDRRGGAVRKPTGWMSNSREVLRTLSRRCQGQAGMCSETGEPHVECSGRVAQEAAVYPAVLCKAILEGFCKQLQCDGLMEAGVTGIDVAKQCQIVENQAKLKENFAKIAEMTGSAQYRTTE